MKLILEKNIIGVTALTMAIMLCLMKVSLNTTQFQPVNASSAIWVTIKPCSVEDTPNTIFFY